MRHKITADLRWPDLWRGRVVSYAPLLGPSGRTLQDDSGFRNAGTWNVSLTDAATPTVVHGKHALNLDQPNGAVTFPVIAEAKPTNAVAVVAWCTYTSALLYSQLIRGPGDGASSGYRIWYNINGAGAAANSLIFAKTIM